jgi:myo-inositol-1(or 4)-monophosphatase
MQVAMEAAQTAGQILIDRFQTSKEITYKGPSDIVTDVDLAAEKAILDLVRAEFPDFGILSEESEPILADSDFTWVIDPLDGTRNYANGIPHYCTLIALLKGGEPVLAVSHDPARHETFTAQTGSGAFLNGQSISVSSRRSLGEALLSCDLGYVDEKAGLALDMIRALWPGMLSLRLLGSAGLGLAYAAAGRVDLFFHHSLSPWDVAGGLLLLREAGGEVVDRQGKRADLYSPSVIGSNGELIQDFLRTTDGLAWRELPTS